MQIVYISIRPEIFQETLDAVGALMPWVASALVVVPDRLVECYRRLPTPVPLRVVAESDCLGSARSRFDSDQHHQTRSFLLRRGISRLDAVEEEFLLSDDDYRPLGPIDSGFFRNGSLHRAYHFYDLLRWPGTRTHYDEGLRWTGKFLSAHGFPTLAYSAHMPQVVRKSLFREALDFVVERTGDPAPMADEWSIYFNIAATRNPRDFETGLAYATLCWPPLPTDWDLFVEPVEYLFENYYPDFYERGHCFQNLPRASGREDWRSTRRLKVDRMQYIRDRAVSLQENRLFVGGLGLFRALDRRMPRVTGPLKPLLFRLGARWFGLRP